MQIQPELITAVKNKKTILFVGAGLSMNLGLPSWSVLIEHMAADVGYKPEEFLKLGNFLELAEYYKIQKGSIGPLRSWMDTHYHAEHINIRDSEPHRLIVEIDFPIIYTTNYDRWIEKAYEAHGRPYDKISGIFDLAKAHSEATQIVKYHGDFDNDDSIMLTETSYFDRLGLDTALDVKLRADSLGKSFLFIGYSLSDIDIRYLLYKLQKLWGNSLEKNIAPRSYIFLARKNPVQKTVLNNRGIETIYSEEPDPGKALVDFLVSLHEAVGTA